MLPRLSSRMLRLAVLALANLAAARSLGPMGAASGADTAGKWGEGGGDGAAPYPKPVLAGAAALDIEARLRAVLPGRRPTAVVEWPSGLLPANCLGYFGADGRAVGVGDFAVYNVTYEDCGTPWVFCRHVDAGVSIEDMSGVFGRLPVGMRELVRTMVALPPPPAGDGWAAFSANGDIAVRPCCWDVRVLAHEASHILDSTGVAVTGRRPLSGTTRAVAAAAAAGGARYSDSRRWRGAESRDESVVSRYALTTWAEHFAEMAGLGLLEAAGGAGSVAAASPAAGRALKNQVETWVMDWGHALIGRAACRPRAMPSQAEVLTVS